WRALTRISAPRNSLVWPAVAAAAELSSVREISMINLSGFELRTLGCPFARSREAASGLRAPGHGRALRTTGPGLVCLLTCRAIIALQQKSAQPPSAAVP